MPSFCWERVEQLDRLEPEALCSDPCEPGTSSATLCILLGLGSKGRVEFREALAVIALS